MSHGHGPPPEQEIREREARVINGRDVTPAVGRRLRPVLDELVRPEFFLSAFVLQRRRGGGRDANRRQDRERPTQSMHDEPSCALRPGVLDFSADDRIEDARARDLIVGY